MISKRRRRAYYILLLLFGVSAVVGLILYALRQNINLFYTPTQLHAQANVAHTRIRLGGMVQEGSLQYADALSVQFIVTDLQHTVPVTYAGILPDLFREGQGIVALGHLNTQQIFVAEQILAKHDEKYTAPQ